MQTYQANPSTQTRISAAVGELLEFIEEGMDEFEAARKALAIATPAVHRELAVAGLVAISRHRRRAESLQREREAERRNDEYQARPDVAAARKAREADENAQFEERRRMMVGDMRRIVDDYTKSLRLEWTAELLATEIVLPDGTRKTWAEVTPEQHDARAEQFEARAIGNLEGAARHRVAASALRASGFATLAEMVAS